MPLKKQTKLEKCTQLRLFMSVIMVKGEESDEAIKQTSY